MISILSLLIFLAIFSTSVLINAQTAQHHLDTIRIIDNHNADPNNTFFMRFSDISALTPEQYKQRLGYRLGSDEHHTFTLFEKSSNLVVPDFVDWRQSGVVNRVKDQGQCGSCWAFSAIGALESQHAIVRGTLVDLSEQNLVDCSIANNGCDGGWMNDAFAYIAKNGGVDTEQSYPYLARQQENCSFSANAVGETLHSYVNIAQGNEQSLKEVVAQKGPVSVAIDASNPSFQYYGGGVYYEPACKTNNPVHAVVVIGYGTDPDGGDYWLIKNSWNTWWGEQGYMRMARNRDNHCGIASYASFPQLSHSSTLSVGVYLFSLYYFAFFLF